MGLILRPIQEIEPDPRNKQVTTPPFFGLDHQLLKVLALYA